MTYFHLIYLLVLLPTFYQDVIALPLSTNDETTTTESSLLTTQQPQQLGGPPDIQFNTLQCFSKKSFLYEEIDMRETSFTNSECKSKCIWLSGTVTPIRFHGDFYGCLDDLDIQLGGNNTLDSFFTDSLTDCRNMKNETNFASTTQINKEYSFVCCKFNLCNDEYHKQLIDTHPPTTSTSGKEFNRAGNVDISNADSPTWIPVNEEKKTPIYVTFNELPTNEVNVSGDYIKKLVTHKLHQQLSDFNETSKMNIFINIFSNTSYYTI